MTEATKNLLGMSREELREYVVAQGERPFRGEQLFRWLYMRGATGFGEMTDIARVFREELSARASLRGIAPVITHRSAADGTVKFVFGLEDGLQIESVLIPRATGFEPEEAEDGESTPPGRGRLTLCVSTQVGCPLDCKFCATGTMGFVRNLTAGEIVDQVLAVRRATGKAITNVVFMGMGEPMLNYDAALKAAELMTSGISIAARRITISTAGWADGIRRMADEKRRMKLAVSLHSAVEETRRALMPITRRFPLRALHDAVVYYYAQLKQRITFEVVFFDGVNDSPREVSSLLRFVRAVPSKVNVIPYHAIGFAHPSGLGATLRPSPRREEIVRQLRDANLTVMVRSSAGEDIAAACGQLVVPGGGRRGSHHQDATRHPSSL